VKRGGSFILRDESFLDTVKHIAYWWLIYALVFIPLLIFVMFRDHARFPGIQTFMTTFAYTVFSFVIFVVYVAVWAGLVHLLFKLFEGKGTYVQSVQIIATTGLFTVLAFPVVSYLELISDNFLLLLFPWYAYMALYRRLKLLKTYHKTSWTRTLLAYGLVYIPMCIALISLFVILIGTFAPELAVADLIA